MSKVMNSTDARKNFYKIIEEVNINNSEIEINNKNGNNAVLVSRDNWDSIMETLKLEQIGVMDKVRDREKDSSGFTNVDDIDWDNL